MDAPQVASDKWVLCRAARDVYFLLSISLIKAPFHQPLGVSGYLSGDAGMLVPQEVYHKRYTTIGPIDLTRIRFTRLHSSHHPSPFLHAQELHQPTLPYKIAREPILYNPHNSENFKMSQPHINDNISNSFNNTNSFNNVWNNCTVGDEKSEIFAWLSPLEPQIRHHDIQASRVPEVGDWLLQTEEYQNWFGGTRGGKSDGSALLCYGGPGVGKTYIK